MWMLKDAASAPYFKAQLDSCKNLVTSMLGFLTRNLMDATANFQIPGGRVVNPGLRVRA